MIPHSKAIALAVNRLSPVTILTLTPAFLHYEIAPGTSYLKRSLIPIKQIKVKLFYSTSNTPLLSLFSRSKKINNSIFLF